MGSLENPFFREGEGVTKNLYISGGIAWKGGLGQFVDLREGNYRSNIYMAPYTGSNYINKTVFIKKFADRQIELKNNHKMLSQIGLIRLFCSPYLPQGSYRISIFVFPF